MAGGSRRLPGADSKPGNNPNGTHGQTLSITAGLPSNLDDVKWIGNTDECAVRGIDGPTTAPVPSPGGTAHGPPTSSYIPQIEDSAAESQSTHCSKRPKPAGNATAASAPKRRATGILSTAISWARSQEADLAAFGGAKALEGHPQPLPPLPVPNRKQAAAEHDMLKASQRIQRQPRATRSGAGQSSRSNSASPVKQSTRSNPSQKPTLPPLYPSLLPDSLLDGNPAAVPQHPVEIAFANGTDEQMAAYIGVELGRLNEIAQADPNQYALLAEECKRWAAGAIPTVAGLTTEDLERAQKHLKAAMDSSAAAAPGSTSSGGRPMLPPDPRASSYFIQPGQQSSHPRRLPYPYQGLYGGSAGNARQDSGYRAEQRYPRRSCRGRNKKQDELYLTLDSDYEGEDEEDEDDDLQYSRGERARADGKRGPGRPRKQVDGITSAGPSSQRYAMQNETPRAYQLGVAAIQQQPSRLRPQQPSPSAAYLLGEVLSPFAQFLFEQQGPEKGSTAKAGVPTGDAVDFAALDDFIAGLNFANDAVLGSPGAAAMLKMAEAARGLSSPATTALVQPMLTASAALGAPLLPGMVPFSGVIAVQPPEPMAATAEGAVAAAAAGPKPSPSMPPPATMDVDGVVVTVKTSPQDPNATKSPPSQKLLKPPACKSLPSSAAGPPLVAPVLPPILDLDLAVCKPLETPTLAGMLSLGLSKKSPTHPTPSMASPALNPLLSPTLLNLHF